MTLTCLGPEFKAHYMNYYKNLIEFKSVSTDFRGQTDLNWRGGPNQIITQSVTSVSKVHVCLPPPLSAT